MANENDGIVLIKEGAEGYYEEKKSRFLAFAYPVGTEEEAVSLIEAARKKYWDARHNCYAFVIGENNELTRCSDDGEPQGTAGRPILETILSRKIHNCLVIVTRYFGGTLLGTGGLVRAYQKASADALDNSELLMKTSGSRLTVKTDYNSVGKIQHAAAEKKYIIEEIQYGEQVVFIIAVQQPSVEAAVKDMADITAGRAEVAQEKNIDIYVPYPSSGRT